MDSDYNDFVKNYLEKISKKSRKYVKYTILSLHDDCTRRDVMYKHAPPFVECKPEDPIHQPLNNDLEEEEYLREDSDDRHIIHFQEVTAVSADALHQTTIIRELPWVVVVGDYSYSSDEGVSYQEGKQH